MLINRTLRDIGAGFGLPELGFSERNVAALRLGEADTLFFERQGDVVFMSLARPAPPHLPGVAGQALRLCAPQQGLPMPVRPGLSRDGELVFTVRFTEQTFTVTQASQSLTLLRTLQARATE